MTFGNLTSPLLNTLLQGESIHQTPCLFFFHLVFFKFHSKTQVYPKLSKIFDVATGKLFLTAETRCPTVKEQVPGGIEEAAKSASTC